MTTTTTRDTPPRTRGNRVGWSIVLFLALMIALISIGTYASQSLESLGETSEVARTYAEGSPFLKGALYVHIVSASAALVLGPAQFSRRLRNRYTAAHRVTGRVYAVSVLFGGLSGVVIAPSNSAGLIGTAGFGLLGALWVATMAVAVRAARHRDLQLHQAWMIRNYALTFAAVTLRLWLMALIPMYLLTGLATEETAFASAYIWVPFLCWVPNIVVAEWLIRRRGLPPLASKRVTPAQ